MSSMRRLSLVSLCVVTVLAPGGTAQAQDRDFSQVQVQTVAVAPGLSMLKGAGGNIGVSVGDDGVFLIDDQYAPLTDKIKAAVATLTDQADPLRAQHPLARRPHRRQREPGQGRGR